MGSVGPEFNSRRSHTVFRGIRGADGQLVTSRVIAVPEHADTPLLDTLDQPRCEFCSRPLPDDGELDDETFVKGDGDGREFSIEVLDL
jgi:hypothetical protein